MPVEDVLVEEHLAGPALEPAQVEGVSGELGLPGLERGDA
jgi:hypothetical protein